MKDKLVNYCNVVRGVSYSPPDLKDSYKNDTYYLLRSNNIKRGKLVFEDVQIVDEKCVSLSQKLEEKDIAVCMSNGSKRLVGKSAQFKSSTNNYCVGAFCAGFRPNIKSVPDYIFQLFQSQDYQKYIDVTLAGSAINNLKGGDVLDFEFSFPPLPQQRKIAKILSICDEVIEKTEAAISKYEALKQGMMHDLFSRGIDVKTGKLRPSYKEAPELYQESELGFIPKDWEVKKLEDFLILKSGDGITSKDINDFGEYPVYGGNGLRGYTNSYTHEGDYVLIGRQGALCGNITLASGRVYASEHAVVVTITDDSDVKWIEYKLRLMNLNQYSEASAQPGLSVGKIVKLSIKVPKGNEQQLIAKRFIGIENRIKTELEVVAKYQQLKAGLMQDLLTGKVEVSVAEEILKN